METSPRVYEERSVNRVEVVDALSQYGEIRLADIIDLNDGEVIKKIYWLAEEWGVHEDVLFNACLSIPKWLTMRTRA